MYIFDEYEWLENINDLKVISWAKKLNSKFRDLFDSLSSKIYHRILEVYKIPLIPIIHLTGKGIYMLIREYNSYKIKFLNFNGESIDLISSKDIGKDVVIHNLYTNTSGSKIAYSYSIGGSDESKIRILDVNSMDNIDELEGFIYSITWIDDERYYYVRAFRRELTPDKVKPPATRIFLREGKSETMIESVKPPSMHYINLRSSDHGGKALISINRGWIGAEFWSGDLSKPEDWKYIYGDLNTITDPVDYFNGKYIIVYYGFDGNGDIRYVWNDNSEIVVVEDTLSPIIDAIVMDDKIIVHKLFNASSKLEFYDFNGKSIGDLRFPKPVTIKNLQYCYGKTLFKIESYLIPYQIHLIDKSGHRIITSMELELDYEIIEDTAISSDGTPIHFFIVKRRDKPIDKVLLYGYGGFRISLTPSFTPIIKILLEDGLTYAVANIRGGLEYGEKWHKAGMLHNKQNVFEDFKAVIRKFKSLGAKVAISGRSNGGLLVSAIITQNPEIVDCAIIGYPVIDMLKFHKLHPGVARLWILEYGDPDNPIDREYLLKYSPYHNVKPKMGYPPTLIYTGLKDDRVHPAHALKFVAKLIDVGANVYLRLEEMSGHLGSSPEVKAKEEADILTFIYSNFKVYG